MTGMTYASLIAALNAGEGVMMSASIERTYNKSTFWHGATRQEFFSNTEINLSFEMELCASGIVPVLGGSGNIASVQASYEEITSPVQLVSRYPGQEMPDDERLVKASDACFHFLGTNNTFNVTGRGEQVWDDSDQGTKPGAITFTSAQGTFSITTPADAKIEQVGQNSSNNGDPDQWTGTLFYFEPNSGTITEHTLDVPDAIAALIPASTIYKISESYAMDGSLEPNARHTINVIAYPTT